MKNTNLYIQIFDILIAVILHHNWVQLSFAKPMLLEMKDYDDIYIELQ